MTQSRILVVEDEFLIRMTLAEALAEEGYEVCEAGSGDEAIALLRTQPSLSLMMTDIQLPGDWDGLELARVARETWPELPIIFMTGRPDMMGQRPADAREAFVAKPYLSSEICAVVRRLIAS